MKAARLLAFLVLLAPLRATAEDAADPYKEAEETLRAQIQKRVGEKTPIRRVGLFVLAGPGLSSDELDDLEGTVKRATKALSAQFFTKVPDHLFTVYLFPNYDSYLAYCRDTTGEAPISRFGFYLRASQELVMNIGTGSGTLVHEMTHALMDSDFPGCPSWFSEGLASLYEMCTFEDDGKILGHENWRLPILQRSLKDGSATKWKDLAATTTAQFYGEGFGLRYAVGRYLCMWLQEKGLLEKYYKAFRDGRAKDPSGWKTLEALFDRPIADVEKDWKDWAAGLEYR